MKDDKLEFLKFGFLSVATIHKGVMNVCAPHLDWAGVYIMVLNKEVFNVGESADVGKRLRSYKNWLSNPHNGENDRSIRERKSQEKWNSMTQGKSLEVFARKSQTVEIFGELVCNRKTEEMALIQKFKPQWNNRRASVHCSLPAPPRKIT